MRFKIPNTNDTVSLDLDGLSLTCGVNDEVDVINIHPVVPAVALAVASATAFSVATAAGVPTVAAAGCCAAIKPLVDVNGYYRQDGTYVRGHERTWPDCIEANNFS